ncbi:MAG: hypothetical protein L6R39_005605 [Caloplaca ligustica]|nr:MAG: hypothetical protein L6R39_005605 [Caloplaca ligustica]
MPRSQTLPALSIDVKASESDNSRKNSKPEMADDEESPNEICQSPSWSDFGGAKRKKEKKRQEKERKEEEKRLRKEVKLQAAADLRAGKRLSKRPPPAAMETQKLPAVLRRNSIVSFLSSQSSSGENTRRLSRDEKRLSVASIDSAKSTLRSQSSPATSTDIRLGSSEGWKTIVSALAPQLPSLSHLGWHSRGGSSGTDKTKSWASEDAYEKELVNFAYQFQASAVPSSPTDVVLENVKVNQLSVQQSPKRHSGAWRMDRTKTESNLTDLKSNVKVKKLEPLPAVPKTESSGDNVGVDGPPRSRGAHADGSPARPRSREAANKARGDLVDGKAHRPPTETIRDIPQAALALATQGRPPVYGSSYVHKQRMHQQQRSIAGFEDEQAVRIATEWLAEEKPKDETQELAQEDAKGTHESVPQPEQRTEDLNLQGAPNTHGAVHQPQQQTEPPKSRPNVSSVPSEPKARAKEPSLTVRSSLDKHGVKAPRGSSDVAQSPTSRSSRVDKLLGFTRRQKPEQEKEASVGKASVPSTKGSRTSPPPPPPPKKTLPPPVPSSPQAKLASVQVQKAVETSPEARQHRRSESVEIVKPDVKAEEGKPSLVRSHSRTRTSSSQLLNDELPMPRPLPRSTTAPELSREMKLPSAMTDRTRNESPSKPGRKSVTFERTMDGNPEVAPSPETAVVKTPEIVVESVSPEGVIRKTSITRPRSNPNVQLAATTAQLPSLDFLPQLKHQPLPKRSPNRASFMQYPERPTSSHFPAPALFALKPAPGPSASLPLSSSAPNLQGSPHRPESYAGPSAPGEMSLRRLANNTRRSTSSPGAAAFSRAGLLGPPNVFGNTPTPSESVNAKPIAKLFVICCKCNYWHDLPSHLYEAMCLPKNLTRDPEGKGAVPKEGSVAEGKKKKVAEATLETMVKCPWCEHFMTTWCCAGWTAILYLQERHH